VHHRVVQAVPARSSQSLLASKDKTRVGLIVVQLGKSKGSQQTQDTNTRAQFVKSVHREWYQSDCIVAASCTDTFKVTSTTSFFAQQIARGFKSTQAERVCFIIGGHGIENRRGDGWVCIPIEYGILTTAIVSIDLVCTHIVQSIRWDTAGIEKKDIRVFFDCCCEFALLCFALLCFALP
jgi:hypothetical protein